MPELLAPLESFFHSFLTSFFLSLLLLFISCRYYIFPFTDWNGFEFLFVCLFVCLFKQTMDQSCGSPVCNRKGSVLLQLSTSSAFILAVSRGKGWRLEVRGRRLVVLQRDGSSTQPRPLRTRTSFRQDTIRH